MSESAPETQKVRAIDVRPYRWGIWCTVGNDPRPFTNAIEHLGWSEDGQHIWFGLGSHNFHKASPDEMIELVPIEPGPYSMSDEFIEKEHAAFLAKRPTPTRTCDHCSGSGKVPA